MTGQERCLTKDDSHDDNPAWLAYPDTENTTAECFTTVFYPLLLYYYPKLYYQGRRGRPKHNPSSSFFGFAPRVLLVHHVQIMNLAPNMSTVPPTQTTPDPAQKKPEHVNRACEPCRLLKVRCLPSLDPATRRCQRCTKNGRTCHYAAPQKRRPRKRTDTRVAELEREVRAMRSLLSKSKQSPSADSNQGSMHTLDETEEIEGFLEQAPIPNLGKEPVPFEDMQEPKWGCGPGDLDGETSDTGERSPDVIERDLIGLELAQEFFDHYVNNMIQHSPIVAFRPGETAETVRSSRPTLFLTILAAAAGQKDHQLYLTLHEELLQVFADRYILNSDKSLELVQCFLLTCIWLYPPNDFRTLKFYQYVHMAASMSLDIGQPDMPGPFTKFQWPPVIADDFKSTMGGSYAKAGDTNPSPADPNADKNLRQELLVLESKRTHLSCYLICASVSMSLRRPNMFAYSAFTKGCIDYLTNSPYALPSDKLLIIWSKIQHITEESAAVFAFDDLSSRVEMSDPRVQLTLKGFENRLEEYRRTIEPELLSSTLDVHYYMNKIILQEYAIMVKNADGFQPEELIDIGAKAGPISMASASAIMTVIESAHLLLDAFFSEPDEVIRCYPVVNFVRMSYGMVLLIKMYANASLPDSELGKILDAESLKIDHYLRMAVTRLKRITDYRAASKFLQIVLKVAMYHQQRLSNAMPATAKGQGAAQLVGPLLNLVMNSHGKPTIEETTGGPPQKKGKRTNVIRRTSRPAAADTNDSSDPSEPWPVEFVGSYLTASNTSPSNPSPSSAQDSSYTHNASISTATTGTTDFSGASAAADTESFPQQPQGWFQPSAEFGGSLLPNDMDVDIFAFSEGMEFTSEDLNTFLPFMGHTSSEMQMFEESQNWTNWGPGQQ
ncbi:hypothetical protein V490_08157 [Pseudogymnoascus sp. VKM F-3557]|nr:hypothetical protein V490_08157 [Pseudogymnoascus sp. VKM F-3557]